MEVAEDGTGGAVFVGAFVGFFVEQLAFGGEAVLGPDLLVVDECALARAVEPVLKGGERDHFNQRVGVGWKPTARFGGDS